ncbi:MAG: hypothetical protein HY650_05190 [Acidobacteria bacterium]|nr:hypothetical protein [Acidobacteriota bacterium]
MSSTFLALMTLLQERTVLSGESRSISWEVVIVGGLVILILLAGLFWLLRRARKLAQSDEGEGWGYDRFSLMREESSREPVAVADSADTTEAPTEPVVPQTPPVPLPLPAAPDTPSEIGTQPGGTRAGKPAGKITAEPEGAGGNSASIPVPVASLEPRLQPGFSFQAAAAAEASGRRSLILRVSALAVLALLAGAILLSPPLQRLLGKPWSRALEAVNPAERSDPSKQVGLSPLPHLDVVMVASVEQRPDGSRSASLQIRVKNVSSESYPAILIELALTPAFSRVPETRLLQVEPPGMGPNQERIQYFHFQPDQTSGYQITRMLKPDGEEIPFRLTNQIPTAPTPSKSAIR